MRERFRLAELPTTKIRHFNSEVKFIFKTLAFTGVVEPS